MIPGHAKSQGYLLHLGKELHQCQQCQRLYLFSVMNLYMNVYTFLMRLTNAPQNWRGCRMLPDHQSCSANHAMVALDHHSEASV